jgi:soluble lytic murein transglycosylase-like protein
MSSAVRDGPVPEVDDRETRLWIYNQSRRIAPWVGDEERARTLLHLVNYEARRAGLDPYLVLAVIDVESHFHKYAVSRAGARGLMQVMPFWVKEIGAPSQSLFHERTNLRYGCAILRMYIDMEAGNLYLALGRYNGSRGRPEYPNAVLAAWKKWEMGTAGR